MTPTSATIPVASGSVPGLLLNPSGASACYVFAHGAGAGMRHRFMEAASQALAERGVATLRFEFPYMAAGGKRTDPPAVAESAVRAAVAAAGDLIPGLPLYAGGKSFGGRMTSNAQSRAPLPGVRGLVFFGFPLHQPGKPDIARAEHLDGVAIPMLFLQGTRDTLAKLDLVRQVTERLGQRATLHVVEGGDHSFAVQKRSGKTNEEVLDELADAVARWLGR